MGLEVIHPVAIAGALMFFLVTGYFLVRGGSFFVERDGDLQYTNLFRTIIALVPLIAGMSYLLMGYGLGFVTINGEQIAYLRYFEWSISTMIIIFGLTILTQDRTAVAWSVGLDYLMIVAGFLAAISSGVLRLLFFTVSLAAFIGLTYVLYTRCQRCMDQRSEHLRTVFERLRTFVIGLFALYPVAYMLSANGIGVLSPSSSITLFLVLDLVSKTGFILLVAKNVQTMTILNT